MCTWFSSAHMTASERSVIIQSIMVKALPVLLLFLQIQFKVKYCKDSSSLSAWK